MTALDNYFEAQTNQIINDIDRVMRVRGKMSNLIEKGVLPEGVGYNYSRVVSERSAPTGGITWSPLETPDGTTNNCTPTVTDSGWASSLKNYEAFQALLRSPRICFVDAARGYLGMQQIEGAMGNIVSDVFDGWDDRDKDMYFLNAYHKVLVTSTAAGAPVFTDFEGQADYDAVKATNRLTQDALDLIYSYLDQDGAGEYAYARNDGAPVYTVMMSMLRQKDLFNQDATVRQVLEFAEMGESYEGTLLKGWGVKRVFRGFMHLIDNKMPRWNWTNGGYVRVPYYTNVAAHRGAPTAVQSEVNPAYRHAQYEDVFIWNPKVVRRLMPKAPHSMGSETSFEGHSYAGEVFWRNNIDTNPNSPEYNPLGNFGRYWAPMTAAYEPNLTRYGYILRVRICDDLAASVCYP